MDTRHQKIATLAIVGSLLGACGVEGAQTSELSAPAIAINGIALNAIAINGLVANHVVASSLADEAIATDEATASQAGMDLMAATGGMELFSYIVSCALPEGSVVSATVDGTAHEFHGLLGLAPDWESRGLTLSERRWVSACLLARVNAYGMSVQISMRGAEALTPTAAERAEFSVVEGAFYGNVFVSDASKLEMVACRGAGQAAGESGGLTNRDCTEPAANGLTKCGMKYAGDCLDFTPASPSPRACVASSDGNYTHCTAQAALAPRLTLSSAEVVTVYVRP